MFGITGSILVFYEAIDNVLNADLSVVQASAQGKSAFHSLAKIQSVAVAAMPPQAKLRFVNYPADATSSYRFGFVIPAAVADDKDEWQVHVNPYTAQVLGKHLIKKAEDVFPSALIPFVFRLHFTLLAGETGGIIVGIMGVILLFSVFTGDFSVFVRPGLSGVICYRPGSLAAKTQGEQVKNQEKTRCNFLKKCSLL